jgi:protein TonB
VSAPKRVFTAAGKLLAPIAIPEKVAMLKEQELPPDIGVGVAGGVPGGVAGGQMGGVIGGILQSAPHSYIPLAPPAPRPKAPIRVGGRVKAPRAISAPSPPYPILARQAKVQGNVMIDAVIDASGNVVEISVVSGHPLLIPAAIEALRKWKYEPTYLNEEAVAVRLLVTVEFRLN